MINEQKHDLTTLNINVIFYNAAIYFNTKITVDM